MGQTFIKPCEGRLTSPFGERIHPIRKVKSWHQGIDLAKRGEVKIFASADGEVIRTGALGTYGNVVMIRHHINGKHMETNYAHLHSDVVKVGQHVKQGQHIGYMGNTGSSTAQHLHFEIHDGKWSKGQPNAVDPLPYITEKPKEEVELVEKPVKPSTRYSDVGTQHTAYNALERLSKLDIINGYPDGSFRPNEPLTRAHMAIIVDRLVKQLKG